MEVGDKLRIQTSPPPPIVDGTRKQTNAQMLDDLLSTLSAEYGDGTEGEQEQEEEQEPAQDQEEQQPLFVPLANTVSALTRHGKVVISGALAKLAGPSDLSRVHWKARFFVLTQDRRLFLFRADPTPAATPPVTFLPVVHARGFYNTLLRLWILVVGGRGVNSARVAVDREWALACTDA
ncbi:hypothetical protein HK100_011326, partial [Physocladia obscura]